MKIPLSWLREYVDIVVPVDELAHRLTMAGTEVAEVVTIGGRKDCYVGSVTKVERHPNHAAGKLQQLAVGDARQSVYPRDPVAHLYHDAYIHHGELAAKLFDLALDYGRYVLSSYSHVSLSLTGWRASPLGTPLQ